MFELLYYIFIMFLTESSHDKLNCACKGLYMYSCVICVIDMMFYALSPPDIYVLTV